MHPAISDCTCNIEFFLMSAIEGDENGMKIESAQMNLVCFVTKISSQDTNSNSLDF